MKKLTATLVHSKGTQTWYKLSDKIKKGRYFGRDVNIEEDVNLKSDRIKKEYIHVLNQAEGGVDLIVISDAANFIERLVFAGCEYTKNGEYHYSRFLTVIDGKNTMSIHGGDSNSVYEHEVYLRHLASINGFTFGGIIK